MDGRSIEIQNTFNPVKTPFIRAGDFALPGAFRIEAVVHDPTLGPLETEIDVEIVDGRARARKVSVSTPRPNGVSSTVQRAVPIKDVLAAGVRRVLHTVELVTASDGKPNARITPLVESEQNVAAVVATVSALVKYLEVKA